MDFLEIKQQITDEFVSDPVIISEYSLESGKSFEEQFLAASLESILFDSIATAILLSTQQFAQLKLDIAESLNKQKAHRANWYAYKARQFQFGMTLIPNKDIYDNTALTTEQIEVSKIIKYAAAVDSLNKSVLYLKIATGNGH